VFLVSLPGTISLIALALSVFPRNNLLRVRPRVWQAAAVFAVTVALVPLFMIARWGNENYEMTRPNELAGVQALYDIAPPGSTLVAMDLHVPWLYQNVDDYDYKSSGFVNFANGDMAAIENEFKANPSSAYLIITTGQVEFGRETYGLRANWANSLESTLTSSGHFELVYENPDTQIFKYQEAT
jgi:hypothetical protein